MKAVNLIPKDARRARGLAPGFGVSPAYPVLGVLAVALVFVVVYVLTSNTISSRKAQLANVNAQLTAQQAEAARLAKYVQFETLAQTRVQTVRQIAAARFDWYRALSDLSKVVPADTSLQALTGTVAPGASAGGTSGGSASGLRGDITAPAFELAGCTKTQDDVARLMSRLRVINGVTRVTLGNSQKPGGNGGSAVSATGGGGCGGDAPTFDLVVFFQPLAGAGATGVTSVASTPTAGTPTATTAQATPATTASTATTTTTAAPATTATTATTATPAATPAGATSGGSQ